MQGTFLTIKEAAAYLKVSEWSIRFWIGAGRLRALKAGRRVLIPRQEIDDRMRQGNGLEPIGTFGVHGWARRTLARQGHLQETSRR